MTIGFVVVEDIHALVKDGFSDKAEMILRDFPRSPAKEDAGLKARKV